MGKVKFGAGCVACGFTGEEHNGDWTGRPCPGCSIQHETPEVNVGVMAVVFEVIGQQVESVTTNESGVKVIKFKLPPDPPYVKAHRDSKSMKDSL